VQRDGFGRGFRSAVCPRPFTVRGGFGSSGIRRFVGSCEIANVKLDLAWGFDSESLVCLNCLACNPMGMLLPKILFYRFGRLFVAFVERVQFIALLMGQIRELVIVFGRLHSNENSGDTFIYLPDIPMTMQHARVQLINGTDRSK